MIRTINGDSREVLKALEPCSVDAVVTDPPYALDSIVQRFGKENSAPATNAASTFGRVSRQWLGRSWDTGETAFDPEFWLEVKRVLKPGGHVLAFTGSRALGRLQSAFEAAGLEIRDSVLSVVDADEPIRDFAASLSEEQARAFARCIEESAFGGLLAWIYATGFPKSHETGMAIDRHLGLLKGPAEKPYVHKSEEARRWSGFGTALKPAFEPIMIARKPLVRSVPHTVTEWGTGALNLRDTRPASGGHPANVVTDGSAAALEAFPDHIRKVFYSAKATGEDKAGTDHPTVKPLSLMDWAVRLVTPPGGLVLDPFAGSGSTGLAAHMAGFDALLIERDPEHFADMQGRVDHLLGGGSMGELRRSSLSAASPGGSEMPLFAGV